MSGLIKHHSAPLSALAICAIATLYTVAFDRSLGKELFILYGANAAGLYGLSQQSNTSNRDED